jgi:outer membrane protein assembly factor BamD
MNNKLICAILILVVTFSCSKKETIVEVANETKSFEIYKEALDSMFEGEYFYASKKFSEAELILPTSDLAAKSLIMSSFCLYQINFYDESLEDLEKFIVKYPVNKNIAYAHYLIANIYFEQILDEKKDLEPLTKTKEKIFFYLNNFPNNDYSIDLQFKLDLVNNQIAAKELYIAKYYAETKKWIAAINRLKVIVDEYDQTIFVEEALHRLVEIYYKIGLEEEAKATAIILGYNYNSSEWYQKSYKLLNKNYKPLKKKSLKKNQGLIKRTIKKILN